MCVCLCEFILACICKYPWMLESMGSFATGSYELSDVVLGTKPMSYARAVSTLSCRVISPVPNFLFFFNSSKYIRIGWVVNQNPFES